MGWRRHEILSNPPSCAVRRLLYMIAVSLVFGTSSTVDKRFTRNEWTDQKKKEDIRKSLCWHESTCKTLYKRQQFMVVGEETSRNSYVTKSMLNWYFVCSFSFSQYKYMNAPDFEQYKFWFSVIKVGSQRGRHTDA